MRVFSSLLMAVAVTLSLVGIASAADIISMTTVAQMLDPMQLSAAAAMGLPAHSGARKGRGILSVRADASSGAEILAAIDGVNKDFSAFKAAVAEKDKELAAKFDDVVTTEKIDRINEQISAQQKAIDDANAKIAAGQMGAGGDGAPKDAEYTAAFRSHFSKGDVQAALNKGADADGGYLAPVEWDRTIQDKLVEVSPMRQISRVQNISGAGFRKIYNQRGTASGWVGETAARPQTATPQLGALNFVPGELYANPAATQQILDDAEVNLEQWLANEVETEFALQEGRAFIAGDGTNKPAGFLTYVAGGARATEHPYGAIGVVQAAAAGAIDPDEIMSLIYATPTSYTLNARFVMNRTSMGDVRKLKDGDGNFLWQPSYAAGEPSQLAGYAVTELPDMPNVASGALPIAFGDFQRGYLIIDRTGVRVLRDPFSNKPYVHFYTTKRVGGGVNDPDAIKVLKMA